MSKETIGMISEGAGAAANIYGMFTNTPAQQQDMQEALMMKQYNLNAAAMKHSQKLQKEMYEYTGYKSRMRQMNEAGLNPALMYGTGGGQGGSTGSSNAIGVSGAQAPNLANFKQANIASVGMALQNAKLQSEIELNKSAAQVNKTQAEKAGGVDTTKVIEETTNLQLRNELQKIDNEIRKATSTDQIQMIANQVDNIKQNTKLTEIEQAEHSENIKKIIAESLKINAETQLTETKINEIINAIDQRWKEIGQNNERMQIEIMKILYDNDAAMEREKLKAWTHLAGSLTGMVHARSLNKMSDELEKSIYKNNKK